MSSASFHFSSLHQSTYEVIMTEIIKSSQVALSQVQVEVNFIEKELKNIYLQMQSQQKKQFKLFIENIQIAQSKIINILESSCQDMIRYAHRRQLQSTNPSSMPEHAKEQKLDVLKRIKKNDLNSAKQKQQIAEITQDILSQLSSCQTDPTWFYLCSTTPLQGCHQANEVRINQQINQAVSNLIAVAEKSLKEFEELYSHSVNDQTIIQLFQYLKNEYQRARRQLQIAVPSKAELIRMRVLCLRVKATVQQQIKKVKKQQQDLMVLGKRK